MVPADCTIIPWLAGTTCATTYMLRRHGTSQYHKCDHLYYVDVVPADHSKYVVGRYHMCGHLYYMDVVLANHSKYDVVGIGKTGPRAGGKQMYCSQGGVQTRERFTG
jgi:hypothetical protein